MPRSVKISLYPSQRKLFNSINKIALIIGGYGSGKTYGGAAKAAYLALINQPYEGAITAPTYGMLHKAAIPAFRKVLDDWEIPHISKISPGGYPPHIKVYRSIVWLQTGDDPEKLHGTNLAWNWADEFPLMPLESWEQLQTRTRNPDAKLQQIIGTGTPIPTCPWLFNKYLNPPDNVDIINARTDENRALGDYSEYLKTIYDPEQWAAFVEGKLQRPIFKGRIYKQFNADLHLDTLLPMRGHYTMTCDFNPDYMSWLLGIYDDNEEILYIIDEIQQMDTRTEYTAAEAVRRFEQMGVHPSVVTVYGDSTARKRSTVGDDDFNIIRDAGFRNFDVPHNPKVPIRINTVNQAFRYNHIIVHPRCIKLIRDLEQVTWKENAVGVIEKSDKSLTHMSDALGYEICAIFGRQYRREPATETVDY